jgi:V/A-type H+-transporting ATPase subunit I
MIVPMQRVTLLCTAARREAALARLQDLGVVHVDDVPAEEPSLQTAQRRVAEAQEALRLVTDAAGKPDVSRHALCEECAAEVRRLAEQQPFAPPPPTVENILALGAEASALEAELDAIEEELKTYRPFGEFNPAAARELQAAGVEVRLFRAPVNALPSAGRDGGLVRVLRRENSHVAGVAIGRVEMDERVERVPWPARAPAEARRRRLEVCLRHALVNRMLAAMAAARETLRRELALRIEQRDFAAARAAMGDGGEVLWLAGYCPEERLAALRDAARSEGWGLVARPPRPDENPPTLLRPPRLFRPITTLFKALGILPGYRETDVSVVFYAFFTIFFAMLVGDAGYGAAMLAGTLLARRKLRRAPSAPFVLMTVFSLATIAWGVLSATYFGIAPSRLPAWARHPPALWLADQSNIMRLCFLLGAIHLSIARLWNVVLLFPHRKALAQLGWIGVIWTMYCAACLVVVKGFAFPRFMPGVAAVSVLMIALFMLERHELRSEGVNLALLPLTIIGSLGDIISYVRLFAVGMASVKVAENFNDMALTLPLPLWAKVPCVALILLVGHGFNLLMGALGILVHGVRLNTLEFSNHKGVTWSGFAYRPFRRRRETGGAVAD